MPKMRPYTLLLLNLLQLVNSAPAPGITYNPTKEASCAVAWDLQTNHEITEHYEVTGHCVFLDSADNLCSGGYRAPGFCPSGMIYFYQNFTLASPPTPIFFILGYS